MFTRVLACDVVAATLLFSSLSISLLVSLSVSGSCLFVICAAESFVLRFPPPRRALRLHYK